MSRGRRRREAPGATPRPRYARVLRVRHLRLSGVLCFLFLEGTVAGAVLLALAELIPWWGVPVLPVVVAAMVKINDVVAGALPAAAARPTGTAAAERVGAAATGGPGRQRDPAGRGQLR